MFGLRCCHEHKELDQSAPIFAQFIDALFQCMCNQPAAFEFNRKLGAFLLFHAYSQLYGDFLGSCYKERVEMERPASIWGCFDDKNFREIFGNPDFTPIEGPISLKEKYWIMKPVFESPIFSTWPGVPVYVNPPEFDARAVESAPDSIPQRTEPIPVEEPSEEPARIPSGALPPSISEDTI
jgi:hypothetical protein